MPKYYLLILALLGSLIRFLYGYLYTPWNEAVDQIAWEILLDQGSLSYDQLIHYPHEGGTIIISLLSHFFKIFTNFNSLTISAFVCDFAIRLIQLVIVKKIFDNKIAHLFGIWSIFATPAIIPWGVVNFGLHSLSSLFPFMLMYLIWLNKDSVKEQLQNGVFLGLAFWFSYINVVIIVVYFLFQIFKKEKSIKWIYALFSLSFILIIHFIVRGIADAGFSLEQLNVESIRGVEFLFNDLNTWKRLYEVWLNPLAGSIIAGLNIEHSLTINKYAWIFTFFLGFLGWINLFLKGNYSRRIGFNLITILFFISLYAISPFYYDSPNLGNYVAYRHLTYIFPLIALFILVGLNSYKYKTVLSTLFLLIGIYSSGLLFTSTKKQYNSEIDRPVGWVLGLKLGHDSERLYKIIETSNRDKKLLLQGVGWGMSTALFKNVESHDLKTINDKTYLLLDLIDDYPNDCQHNLIDGVKFSFTDKVTPKLEKSILPLFLNEYKNQLKYN